MIVTEVWYICSRSDWYQCWCIRQPVILILVSCNINIHILCPTSYTHIKRYLSAESKDLIVWDVPFAIKSSVGCTSEQLTMRNLQPFSLWLNTLHYQLASIQINVNLSSTSSQLYVKYFPFCFLMKVESKICELAFCLAVSTLFSLFKLNISFNCWIRSSIQPLEFSNSGNPTLHTRCLCFHNLLSNSIISDLNIYSVWECLM